MVQSRSVLQLADSEKLGEFVHSATFFNDVKPRDVLRCALLCAHEGGEMIKAAIERRGTSESGHHDSKISAADLVTETDVAVERMIRSRISSVFPGHLFVGEEGTGEPISVEEREGKWVWIVDPIDGTTNFVHAFPVVAVSIAVAFGDDPVLGVVFNPVTDELWFSWKGCGAFMKRQDGHVVRIRTSGCTSLGSALVSTGFAVPFLRRKTEDTAAQEKLLAVVEHNTRVLMRNSRDLRRIGSAACDICFVAMGRTDVFFEFGIKEWDIAAALVILHEAGGDSSTVGGMKPFSIRGRNVLVAATIALRTEMSTVLTDKDAVSSIEAIEK